jgi:prepilin-type N-terminal cleavage/methylation domain-containing protein
MNVSERGITLIEVLAAITILSIITVVLINSLGLTTSAFTRSDYKVEALRIAESELSIYLHEIQTATPLPSICTTECKRIETVVSENGKSYTVTIIETSLDENPAYQYSAIDSFVSLQGISIMDNGTTSEQRLITVIVSWEN